MKKFPDMLECYRPCKAYDDVQNWKEGFEAELRELLPKQIHPTVIQLIKEILGDA